MSSRRFVPVIGLVGGVGSGKSSLANHLKSRRKVAVVDGDAAGHHVLTEDPIKERIQRRFGNSVFDEQGEVIRAELGRRVFGTAPECRPARADLEQFVHPRIREILEDRIEEYRRGGDVEAILLDAAVLFEAGWNDLCDCVVFVETPWQARVQRVADSRGWNEETLKKRESNQWPLERKREAADCIIDNSHTLDDAAAQLEQHLDSILKSNR